MLIIVYIWQNFVNICPNVLCEDGTEDGSIGGGQGWPFEAMLNNLTATALGGMIMFFLYHKAANHQITLLRERVNPRY